jgi:hypothetical protein
MLQHWARFVVDKPLKASISRRVWLYKNDCCLDGQFILVLSDSFGHAIQAFAHESFPRGLSYLPANERKHETSIFYKSIERKTSQIFTSWCGRIPFSPTADVLWPKKQMTWSLFLEIYLINSYSHFSSLGVMPSFRDSLSHSLLNKHIN